MTVSPVRPISAAEAALRVELTPQLGLAARVPDQVAPVASPQASVMDHIALRPDGKPVQAQAAPPPQTPEALVAQAVRTATQAAVIKQDGLAPLLADLAGALRSADLPAPLKAVMAQVLEAQTPLSLAPTGQEVKAAVGRSGLFLEAKLAAVLAPDHPLPTRVAAEQIAAQLAPGMDGKAALLALREALKGWLARNQAPAAGGSLHSAAPRPQPPYRDGPMAGQGPALPTVVGDPEPAHVVQKLLQEATGALAREELMQLASLPDAQRHGPAAAAEGPRWLFELPLTTPQGPAVAQFEVSRDGDGHGAVERAPVWRARFSLDVEPLGPVHVHVAMKPGRAAVTLWAERDDTAERLRAEGGALVNLLRNSALAAEVSVYAGRPKAAPAEIGHLVDQAT